MGEDTLARPVTIAVIDDHQVVLDGIKWWIAQDHAARVKLIGEGYTVDAVLAGPGREADVLILDLGIFGTYVTDRVAELAEDYRVIAFSGITTDETIRGVLDAGASAYLTKHEGAQHFIGTVLAVAADRPYVTPSLAKALLGARGQGPNLSAQEQQALRLWFQHPKVHNVAREMQIAEATVMQYINRARVKYAAVGRPAQNKAAMVARAIEDGLIRPEDVR